MLPNVMLVWFGGPRVLSGGTLCNLGEVISLTKGNTVILDVTCVTGKEHLCQWEGGISELSQKMHLQYVKRGDNCVNKGKTFCYYEGMPTRNISITRKGDKSITWRECMNWEGGGVAPILLKEMAEFLVGLSYLGRDACSTRKDTIIGTLHLTSSQSVVGRTWIVKFRASDMASSIR